MQNTLRPHIVGQAQQQPLQLPYSIFFVRIVALLQNIRGTLNVDMDSVESGALSRVIHMRAALDNDFDFCTTNIVIRDSSNATILSWSNNTGSQVVYGAIIMWDNTESEWTVLSTYTN